MLLKKAKPKTITTLLIAIILTLWLVSAFQIGIVGAQGSTDEPEPLLDSVLSGYGIAASSDLHYGDGGWGGWSVPEGKVILGGGFTLTGGPAATSAPGLPESSWPHYNYSLNEYGWVVQDAPDGANSPGSRVYAIYADKPAGYGIDISPPLNFSSWGWGGWSVPEGKVVLGGGFVGEKPVVVSIPAGPNSSWPHYTYGPNEYGWVVQNGPEPQTIRIYVIYADKPAGYQIVTSPELSYGDTGWGGWSVPEGKAVLGGGFYAERPVAASAPGTPNSVWPHYTYGPNEYGWVVQDAPDSAGQNITIYAICAFRNVVNVNQGKSYDTIQMAIDAAGTGDTIIVAAGTYVEAIKIDKQLTIYSCDGPEKTIIDAGAASRAVDIQADGVTVDGFTITNADRAIGTYHAPSVVKDVTIRNCIVTGNRYGIFVHHSTVDNWTIVDCECTDNFDGLRLDSGADVTGLTVIDSKFSGNEEGGIISYGNITGLTVTGGTFINNDFGIMLGAETSTPHHIKNVLVTETIFDNNTGEYGLGFWVYVYGSTEHMVSNIDIHQCSITNNSNYGVGFDDFGLAGYGDVVINATMNWWGSAAGPNATLNTYNKTLQGDRVSGNVDFAPWLNAPYPGAQALLQYRTLTQLSSLHPYKPR